MKKKSLFKIVSSILVVLIIIISSYYSYEYLYKENDVLHIAVVGPFTGKDQLNGKEMLKGINFYLDHVNKNVGVNGKKIKLHSV